MMNWLDPTRGAVQLLNAVLMLLALGAAAAIPHAFAGGGIVFALCYVLMALIRPLFMVAAFRGQTLARNYRLLGAWSALAGVLWLLGRSSPRARVWRSGCWRWSWTTWRHASVSASRGCGGAPMERWDIDPEHLAERNRLVFIIALASRSC